MDVYSVYNAELCYELYSGSQGMFQCLFVRDCWPGRNLLYCDHCFACEHCFGCIGLRKVKNCIFNKQYTKHEYEVLAARMIEHMRQTSEWGEFFPMCSSPFPYNDSIAQEIFPLNREQAAAQGLGWREAEVIAMGSTRILDPAELDRDGPADRSLLLNSVLRCQSSARLFRLIKQELDLYEKLGVPLPVLHPDERHLQRKKLKNPWRLWQRKCAKSGQVIWSSYAPDRPEIIYAPDVFVNEIMG